MEKWVYRNDTFGNVAIIEEVMVYPYKDARRRQKSYRVVAIAAYDNFVYHISLFETLQEAKDDLKSICFDVD